MPDQIEQLEPFIGEWAMRAEISGHPPMEGGRATFEWMPGGGFVIQRWEIPPTAPNPYGVAIIGFNDDRGTFLQHYFDSRGIARVYEMTFDGRTWTLSRTTPDFTPLDFAQRWSGELSEDGDTITGTWEASEDGSTWTPDLGLSYIRA
jgi:hypothetical protein